MALPRHKRKRSSPIQDVEQVPFKVLRHHQAPSDSGLTDTWHKLHIMLGLTTFLSMPPSKTISLLPKDKRERDICEACDDEKKCSRHKFCTMTNDDTFACQWNSRQVLQKGGVVRVPKDTGDLYEIVHIFNPSVSFSEVMESETKPFFNTVYVFQKIDSLEFHIVFPAFEPKIFHGVDPNHIIEYNHWFPCKNRFRVIPPAPIPTGHVVFFHEGFLDILEVIKPFLNIIVQEIDQTYRNKTITYYFEGFSHGGSLAQMAAYEYKTMHDIERARNIQGWFHRNRYQFHVVTAGAPQISDESYRLWVEKNFSWNQNFIHAVMYEDHHTPLLKKVDPVTQIPVVGQFEGKEFRFSRCVTLLFPYNPSPTRRRVYHDFPSIRDEYNSNVILITNDDTYTFCTTILNTFHERLAQVSPQKQSGTLRRLKKNVQRYPWLERFFYDLQSAESLDQVQMKPQTFIQEIEETKLTLHTIKAYREQIALILEQIS